MELDREALERPSRAGLSARRVAVLTARAGALRGGPPAPQLSWHPAFVTPTSCEVAAPTQKAAGELRPTAQSGRRASTRIVISPRCGAALAGRWRGIAAVA